MRVSGERVCGCGVCECVRLRFGVCGGGGGGVRMCLFGCMYGWTFGYVGVRVWVRACVFEWVRV